MLTMGDDKNDKIKPQNVEKQNSGAELDTACTGRETGYFGSSDQESL